ncbi:MAG: hypothetical protein ABIE92_05315, partial [bacterium]
MISMGKRRVSEIYAATGIGWIPVGYVPGRNDSRFSSGHDQRRKQKAPSVRLIVQSGESASIFPRSGNRGAVTVFSYLIQGCKVSSGSGCQLDFRRLFFGHSRQLSLKCHPGKKNEEQLPIISPSHAISRYR